MNRSFYIALGMVALGACGSGILGSGSGRPSSQQFTREVEAVPASLVKAAITTFGRYGIPIAEADEPGGRVRTMLVNLRSLARRFDEAPLSCPEGTPRETAARFRFDVQVRRTDNGSAMSLETEREGDSACVVRSAFVSALLDEIANTAGGS
ncbi:MAG: hypothetical protein ACREOC_08685 [Gemmatimonadales bacterium]